MPRPSHPPWLYHSVYTWRRVQVMKVGLVVFIEISWGAARATPNVSSLINKRKQVLKAKRCYVTHRFYFIYHSGISW
jgi:hypothetical protein